MRTFWLQLSKIINGKGRVTPKFAIGQLLIGLSSLEAGRRIHHLPLDPGKPRGEIMLWTNDVDQAHAMLCAKNVLCLREPHNFDVNAQLRLRVAWYEDPEGNIFQTVCQRP